VKIIDFGLSQVATSLRTEAAALGSRAGTTLFGQAVFGTLDYAPPEQQGLSQYGKPSAQSDVFSFGATMYRLWTGESPRYFRERELPDVTELRDLLFDCVKTDPRQRPESARELVSRLKAISESQNAAQRAIELEEQAKKRQVEERRRIEREQARQRAEKERKIKEDENAWQQACQSDNKSAYQGYLSGNTVKKYADDAKKRLQAIEEEELAKKRQAEELRRKAQEQPAIKKNKRGWKWVAAIPLLIIISVLVFYTYNGGDRRGNTDNGTVTDTGIAVRYIDNDDGTVTDKQTGLIWLKKALCSGSLMSWKEAMQWAAKLAHGQCGLNDDSKAGDWRLPTRDEWKAMVDDRYTYPTLSNAAGTGQWKEGDAFLGVQSFWYWSSSERSTSSAWFVDLSDGYVNYIDKTFTNYVWAVRGGH
jgi:hypothetical protein